MQISAAPVQSTKSWSKCFTNSTLNEVIKLYTEADTLSIPQIPFSEAYLYPDDSNQFTAVTCHGESLSTTFFCLFVLKSTHSSPTFHQQHMTPSTPMADLPVDAN